MCDPKADPPDALKEGIKQGYEERKVFPEVLPQGVWDKVNVQRFSMKNCGSCEKKCKYYKVRAALKFTDGVVLCNQDFPGSSEYSSSFCNFSRELYSEARNSSSVRHDRNFEIRKLYE